MNDDIQHILHSLTPPAARPALRDQVLDAVAHELATSRSAPVHSARWDLRIGAVVAAAVVLGVALNLWAIRSDDARQARLYGPRPTPRAIVDTVELAEHTAGSECAELVRTRLVTAWQRRQRDGALAAFRSRLLVIQHILSEESVIDVQEDPEMDPHQHRQPDRPAAYRQRDICFA